MKLYVETMDATVVELSPDGQVRFEDDVWLRPTLQERRAIIFSAHNEMAVLAEWLEILERMDGVSAQR